VTVSSLAETPTVGTPLSQLLGSNHSVEVAPVQFVCAWAGMAGANSVETATSAVELTSARTQLRWLFPIARSRRPGRTNFLMRGPPRSRMRSVPSKNLAHAARGPRVVPNDLRTRRRDHGTDCKQYRECENSADWSSDHVAPHCQPPRRHRRFSILLTPTRTFPHFACARRQCEPYVRLTVNVVSPPVEKQTPFVGFGPRCDQRHTPTRRHRSTDFHPMA
jgi:hypothetical protein